jgi:heterodisulfide reductase subunit A-like polyferredoxin
VNNQVTLDNKTIIRKNVLIIGDGISGIQTAIDLATQGFQTILVKKTNPHKSNDFLKVRKELEKRLSSSAVVVINQTDLIHLNSDSGKYQVTLKLNGEPSNLTVGAIVIDVNSSLKMVNDTADDIRLPHFLLKIINGKKLDSCLSHSPAVFQCGLGESINADKELTEGRAITAKVSALLHRGYIKTTQTAVSVNSQLCRGCGQCETVCVYGAPTITKDSHGLFNAQISRELCSGCGLCIAHCPSGALSQNIFGDDQIIASVQALLS